MEELLKVLKYLEAQDMKSSEAYGVVLREIAKRRAQYV